MSADLGLTVRPLRELQVRTRSPELMDDPALPAEQHFLALKGLARLNALSRTARTLWASLRRSSYRNGGLRVLDVACGGGDVTLGIASLAERSRIPLQIDGCDISLRAVQYARAKAKRRRLRADFFLLDVLHDPLPTDYDVFISSLFLHHLTEHETVQLMAGLAENARQGLLLSDLVRTRKGYVAARLASRLFSRSPVVHHDAALSVRAAYSLEEIGRLAGRAGLGSFLLERRWPQRFLLQWWRNGGGS